MGIGALRAAAERGLSVPSDCSIIGFDDIEFGHFTWPTLSTVGQSVRSLGELAAITLIERISGAIPAMPGPGRRRVMAPRLISRESTAPLCSSADMRSLAA
jgi:LacI family transcriptional regulator